MMINSVNFYIQGIRLHDADDTVIQEKIWSKRASNNWVSQEIPEGYYIAGLEVNEFSTNIHSVNFLLTT